ncbi:MAG TPA: hypothetical protein VGT61_03470 [Thermomicrobiales bacterium]|jgi:hypothetical protein|nr:hypothetical protein [Thermomicrobiales bacterium]
MQPAIDTTHVPSEAAQTREGWALSALVSGFIATFCLSVIVSGAYLFASTVGREEGWFLQRWLYGLADNPTANRTTDALFLAVALNLAVGLILALVYAAFVEPRLGGSGWRKGMLFSLVPFVVSVLIVFPMLGIGLLGVDAEAGPLPVLGSLVAHLVYGFVLGGFYGSRVEEWIDSSDHDRSHANGANRGTARGMVIGLPLGFGLGLLMMPLLDSAAGAVAIVLAWTLVGGAVGMLIGSFMGMGNDAAEERR